MKRLIILLLFLLPLFCNAATWWVNFSTGNDANAGSLAFPFKTLAKAQSVFHAGDVLNLNGGDSWHEALSWNGIVQNYGTGHAIIDGSVTLSGWVNVSGNLWRAHDGTLGATVKVLTIGGLPKAKGRFPHATYTPYNGVVGNTQITAPALVGTWTGIPEIVIRKSHFDEQTYPITSIGGTGVVIYPGGGNVPLNNFGCFLQNSPEACTSPGDWAYDGAGNITLYSVGAPTNVKVSKINDLLTLTGNSTVINGIDFTMANSRAIFSNNRLNPLIENFVVTNCDLGFYLNNNQNGIITQGSFNQINGNSITGATSLNLTITYVTGTNIGMTPGAATEYSGIRVVPISARGTTINHCDYSNIGYNAYFVEGTFTASNLIGHDALQVLDDGGIWYSGIGHSPSILPNSTLSNSIFYNAIGAPQGTSNGTNQAVGVYMDDYMNHVTISGVTAYNAGEYVYFSHNNQDITWSSNLGYNGLQAVWAGIHDNLGGKLSNITLSNNQFINTTGYINILRSIAPDALPADLTNFGIATNNHYGNNVTVVNPFQTQLYSQPVQNLTFAGWKTATGQDASSTYVTIPSPSQLYPNPTSSSSPITLGAVYKDLLGNSYSGTVNIAAYSALYLYFFGAIPPSAPSITYVPNSYTFYVNEPIGSVISPINVGGTATSFTISPAQSSGILFGTSNGQISGTPLSLSPSQSYTITAFNGGGNSPTNLVLAVIARPPIVSYTPSTQVATINTAITPFVPSLTGGTVVSWSISPALPTGIVQNASTGLISGTPTVLSPVTLYTAVAHNSGGNTPTNVTLSVVNPLPAPPHIAFSPSTYVLPINVPISIITPISTGGNIDSFSISPSLPASLTFSTTFGTIQGTPTVLSSAIGYVVTAHNSSGDFPATATISIINVAPAPPSISYTPSSATFQKNVAIVSWVPVNVGGASSTWSISPTLPISLSFNTSNGIISGTATVLSPLTSYHIISSNGGGSGSTNVQITVVNAPSTPVIRVRTSKRPIFINRH